jgi:hypothetical protein
MRIIARSSFALGLAAAIGLMASAAANAQAYGPGYGPWGDDARYGHLPSYRGGVYDGAYNAYSGGAYDGAYNAYLGGAYDAYRGSPENFSGTSVPYDASGPGWNDFQLQGR